MIKANELRIGNLINWDTVDSPSYFEINHFKYLDRLRPIPLNDDWLLKFGFVNNSISLKTIDKTLNISAVVDGNYYLFLDDVFGSFYDLNSIQHVHQLQNLYFSLTGEELKLKRK